MSAVERLGGIRAREFRDALDRLYGDNSVHRETAFLRLGESLAGSDPKLWDALSLFSAPGRTELCGNHTDHNRGRILAAAIHLDIVAAVLPRSDARVVVESEGFPPVNVDLATLEPVAAERGKSSALIRGIAARLRELGKRSGGFSSRIAGNVLPGSGLSSSAAFEILVAGIFSSLYNEGAVGAVQLAQIGQYAENQYFGKPCGLMDQLASAHGSVVAVNFADPLRPVVRRASCDPAAFGYRLAVVNTGGSHEDLTDEYAAIPAEMRRVAGFFGKETLSEIDRDRLLSQIPELRAATGDRAILRALHFFAENERVDAAVTALEKSDFRAFLASIAASGSSSWRLLQNCYSLKRAGVQGIALALGVSEQILGADGVCRVHGGGFEGTIQAWVPEYRFEEYRARMEALFGQGSVTELRIREAGFTRLM